MTLEQRITTQPITTVLGAVAPLTAGQLVRALAPTDPIIVYTTLYRMTKRGHLASVERTAIQRHQANGRGNAYTLAAR